MQELNGICDGILRYIIICIIDMKSITTWIVWAIKPDGIVLKHLRSFLAGISSYFHSVNSGRWSFKLRDFLKKISREFLSR